MMKQLVIYLALAIGIVNTQPSVADEYQDPFDPWKVKKISVIEIEHMSRVASACNINDNISVDYWPLTRSFVELVDRLVEKQLQEMDYKTPFNKPIHKQYLGLQFEENKQLVYIFVYPKPSRVIKEEEGNPTTPEWARRNSMPSSEAATRGE